MRLAAPVLAVAAVAFAPLAAACSSCGCTLSTDWSAQGYGAGQGFTMDLRFDYFDQDQLRSGRHRVDRGGIALPAGQEIQLRTINRNTTLTLDYSPRPEWGLTFVLPYFDRYHSTVPAGETDVSQSHSKSIGDLRLIGRYQGFGDGHSNVGVQVGLKFPTGSFGERFSSGTEAGEIIDRGLQPGTGTTDLLLGIYHHQALDRDWDYFGQAMLQLPLNMRDQFRPGAGLNLSTGVRYASFERVVPHVQINARIEARESGSNSDRPNSGATLVYLSPGASFAVSKRLSVYGFGQVPIYQRVNGLALEPRYSVSVGLRYAM
ncbi:MAG: hypothetical protein KF778_08070 [Rhodocyclaceae bacterium]|nr:hypothetical protein [Rhodocyclaceae bacterium]